MRILRLIKKIFSTIFSLIIAAIVIACFCYFVFGLAVSKDSDRQEFVVKEGDTVRQVAANLHNAKLIRSDLLFRIKAKYHLFTFKEDFSPKKGVYKLSPNMMLDEVATMLQNGKQVYITISFPEGYSVYAMSLLLENSGVCTSEEFLRAASNEKILQEFGVEAASMEGYLFPDTYYLTPNEDVTEIVEKMAKNFFTKIKENNLAQGKSPQELRDFIILSSMVEKEYKVPEEAPLIASVFKNRLKEDIGLYSCATIEYIITDILKQPHKNEITNRDLELESPYNTYKWRGLPPGPICNPGLLAMRAVEETPETNYFFFRVKDEKAGTHSFSENFSEHIKAGNK